MKAYLEAAGRSTPKSLRALLDGYQIEWTLLEAEWESVSVLDKLPEWRRVYSDEFAVASCPTPSIGCKLKTSRRHLTNPCW